MTSEEKAKLELTALMSIETDASLSALWLMLFKKKAVQPVAENRVSEENDPVLNFDALLAQAPTIMGG